MKIILSITISIILLLPVGVLDSEKERNDIELDFSDPEIDINEEQIANLGLQGDFFTENFGQKSDGAGFFYAQGNPLSVGFGQGWAAYNLINKDNTSDMGGVLFRTYFVNCNLVEPVGFDPLFHKNNYFIGNDSEKWITGASNYREIWYNSLWDGIDLKYYFKDGMLKYDLIIDPGADPEQIMFEFEGIESLKINPSRDLEIKTLVGSILDQSTYSYQDHKNEIIEIFSSFEICEKNSYKFTIDEYNQAIPLVIDPGMNFSTYLGGNRGEGSGTHITSNRFEIDDEGNSYIGGSKTSSDDFPTTLGAYKRTRNKTQISITKLNETGTGLIYSTFIGSNTSSGDLKSIRLDNSGNIVVVGNSGDDFPTTEGVVQSSSNGASDGILFKLNQDGSDLIFSTYLGGSEEDYTSDVSISPDGSYVILSYANSIDFPGNSNGYDTTHNGIVDAVLTRINSLATAITHGTYYGGSGFERPHSIAIDSDNNIIIGGGTSSTDHPTNSNSFQRNLKGGCDGFLAKFSYDLKTLIACTYIGGSSSSAGEAEKIRCIRIDPYDDIYACGHTNSNDFPTTNGAYDETHNGRQDYFIIKIDKSLRSLSYSTFFGGSGDDGGFNNGNCGISLTDSGSVIFVGVTNSADFPVTSDCFQSTLKGGGDIIIARFDFFNKLIYCSYLGGSDFETTSNTVHHDPTLTTISGITGSSDFPVTNGSFDETHNGGTDYFISRLWTGFDYYPPKEVYNINTYSDPLFKNPINAANVSDEIYIELQGLDGNDTSIDKALVYIAHQETDQFRLPLLLEETGLNTGIYQNSFSSSTRFDLTNRMINVTLGEIINISSRKDPSKFTLIEVVAPVALKPLEDEILAIEDEEYRVHYWNFGYNDATVWTFETNSDWLRFDSESHDIYGTPDNSHVGLSWARLNITDGLGHYDEHYFVIEVFNTLPSILNENTLSALEGEQYYVDYDSDDEGLGHTYWEISPDNIGWLDFDEETGLLSGIPSNDDVGTYDINVSVDDGNGGINWTAFTLTVIDINDPPEILTEPPRSIEQGNNYYVHFNAFDRDDVNTFEWTIETDAGFLEIENKTGVISGTPENHDVGTYYVNITAIDLRGLSGWLNYTLEVIDVNDAPIWSIKPQDVQADEGDEYSFTVKATDIDVGDSISYSISSMPSSDISIDETSGKITWISTTKGLTPNPNYVLNVEISASDGEETITHGFSITVIPNPSPTSTILGPDNGKRITSEGVLLEWEAFDDGEETLKYDIYLGQSQTQVSLFDSSVLWMEDFEGNSIKTGPLEAGKTYYWTVIPEDIYSPGTCTNEVFSFTVNIPPTIQEFTVPEANIGVEWRLSLSGSDLNSDDLEFSIVEGPAGMEIFDGMITWIPAESQVGTQTVNVSLTDEYETIFEEFEVTVAEKEIADEPDDKGSPIVLIIIIVVILILVGAGVGLFLYMKKKKETGPTDESTDEIPPEDTGPPEEKIQAYDQLHGPN